MLSSNYRSYFFFILTEDSEEKVRLDRRCGISRLRKCEENLTVYHPSV